MVDINKKISRPAGRLDVGRTDSKIVRQNLWELSPNEQTHSLGLANDVSWMASIVRTQTDPDPKEHLKTEKQ